MNNTNTNENSSSNNQDVHAGGGVPPVNGMFEEDLQAQKEKYINLEEVYASKEKEEEAPPPPPPFMDDTDKTPSEEIVERKAPSNEMQNEKFVYEKNSKGKSFQYKEYSSYKDIFSRTFSNMDVTSSQINALLNEFGENENLQTSVMLLQATQEKIQKDLNNLRDMFVSAPNSITKEIVANIDILDNRAKNLNKTMISFTKLSDHENYAEFNKDFVKPVTDLIAEMSGIYQKIEEKSSKFYKNYSHQLDDFEKTCNDKYKNFLSSVENKYKEQNEGAIKGLDNYWAELENKGKKFQNDFQKVFNENEKVLDNFKKKIEGFKTQSSNLYILGGILPIVVAVLASITCGWVFYNFKVANDELNNLKATLNEFQDIQVGKTGNRYVFKFKAGTWAESKGNGFINVYIPKKIKEKK